MDSSITSFSFALSSIKEKRILAVCKDGLYRSFAPSMISKNLVVGMQFLPVNIVNKLDSDEKWDYFAVNVHNVVDALHLDGSDYSVLNVGDEKIYTIRKYALRRESIKNQHIFRLLGYEISIFTSEKMKSIIDNNFITGCDFLEVKVI